MSITIVGLGPGDWQMLTIEAKTLLESVPKVYLRTAKHPTVAHLPRHLHLESFDEYYERGDSFGEVYESIARRVATRAQEESVVYAVPGHPLMGEATVVRILELARETNLPVRIVPGLSFVDVVLTALQQEALMPGLQVIDAGQPVFDAARPAIFCQLFDRRVASELKLTLLEEYPPEHEVTLVRAAGIPGEEKVIKLPLYRLDRGLSIDHLTCLFVPPLPPEQNLRSFGALEAIIAKLRSPEGCPWDREQTHASLKPHLIEETYEVLEALDLADPEKLCEEMGDLLMQVFLHAQIASESGEFDVYDVIAGIAAKLIRRHPHVFGDVTVANAAEVVVNWEAIKKGERGEGQSILSGVPKAMPALSYGLAIKKRASRVGLIDEGADELVREAEKRLSDLKGESEQADKLVTLGQALLAITGLAKTLEVDPEEALRLANERFRRQFAAMERLALDRGLSLPSLTSVQVNALWQEAGIEPRSDL